MTLKTEKKYLKIYISRRNYDYSEVYIIKSLKFNLNWEFERS